MFHIARYVKSALSPASALSCSSYRLSELDGWEQEDTIGPSPARDKVGETLSWFMKLRRFAQAQLDAYIARPGATLVDLQDADVMPSSPRPAHQTLDHAVDCARHSGGISA